MFLQWSIDDILRSSLSDISVRGSFQPKRTNSSCCFVVTVCTPALSRTRGVSMYMKWTLLWPVYNFLLSLKLLHHQIFSRLERILVVETWSFNWIPCSPAAQLEDGPTFLLEIWFPSPSCSCPRPPYLPVSSARCRCWAWSPASRRSSARRPVRVCRPRSSCPGQRSCPDDAGYHCSPTPAGIQFAYPKLFCWTLLNKRKTKIFF